MKPEAKPNTKMKKTAEQRRQEGIEKQRAQLAEWNAEELAAAKNENGTWTFKIHGQNRSWMQTAQRMIASLAEREGVTVESLSVCVILPDYGRTFSKAAGSTTINAHG